LDATGSSAITGEAANDEPDWNIIVPIVVTLGGTALFVLLTATLYWRAAATAATTTTVAVVPPEGADKV